MSESDSRRPWLEKLGRFFSDEPKTREDLDAFLELAQSQDLLDRDAMLMIQGVLGVSESRVRDVMIPKVQMVCVDEADELSQILDTMMASSHSRYPVLSAETDEVIGILLAKDVLKAVVKSQLVDKDQLRELYRSPVMVSESKRLNVLLREFKNSRNHMALVVDEYGEVAGLVTIEDVLEQIVGDIEDEHDEDEDNIQKHISGGHAVRAITPLADFNAAFETEIEDDMLETIGGVVNKTLGRIPEEGEAFDLPPLRLTVLKADQRRVESYLVEPLEQAQERDQAEADDAAAEDAAVQAATAAANEAAAEQAQQDSPSRDTTSQS
ncbi:MAG: transporter associated domain-containing protein [Hydrogenovibrio sp.]|uniref:HlyC/CorC family transporter n=1 Tax=Hydrogenovibrio TaxID=28884 RepID=UPI00036ECF5A|nr:MULTISPECIES: CBS domain-containing protein [Hydrogenovibrio]MDR9499311.1 transporter associated domain-containing protein [Hydrogenovibrio sp.]